MTALRSLGSKLAGSKLSTLRIAQMTVGLVAAVVFLRTVNASAQVLTHGPVVGGVTDSAANVFVRTSVSATVALQYGTDPNFGSFSVSASQVTSSQSDFTARISLTSLQPETTYYLRVVVNNVVQNTPPYPSFATFPVAGTARTFNFVVLTDFQDVKNLSGTVDTFQHAAEQNPAFVFIGGDFDHRNPNSLPAKRRMFQDLYNPNTPLMSGFVPYILQKFPIIHQWDDHDSGDNNLDRTYPNWSVAQQAYQEYVPAYPLPGTTPAGIWQKFSYAQLDGFVLDCRSQRDPETDIDNSNKSMLDGNNLGPNGQLQWLKDSLLASTAKWKVIFTSVVTNTSTKYPDGWAGYQTEWNDIKSFIATNNITGIVFISGDLHLGAIDNGSISGFPEMCVAPANTQYKTGGCATAAEGTWSEGYFENPCSGFGLVSVQQNPDRLVLQATDESGVTRVSYTVSDSNPSPTPTPTPTVTPTPTATPSPTPNAPVIVRQPLTARVRVGETATYSVGATGDPPLTYQWHKNGVDIGGATDSTYVTPPVTKDDNRSTFSVTVSNPGGSVNSRTVGLLVR
jgi:alkaline phosphatase D